MSSIRDPANMHATDAVVLFSTQFEGKTISPLESSNVLKHQHYLKRIMSIFIFGREKKTTRNKSSNIFYSNLWKFELWRNSVQLNPAITAPPVMEIKVWLFNNRNLTITENKNQSSTDEQGQWCSLNSFWQKFQQHDQPMDQQSNSWSCMYTTKNSWSLDIR